MTIIKRLMVNLKVNGHSTVVWYWSGDPMVPRSNPLLVKKFLLLSLLIWKGGFEILPNDTWDLLKKAYGTSKKLRFQFRGQLNKPFSEPTYLYTNLTNIHDCALNELIPFNCICSKTTKIFSIVCWEGQLNLIQGIRFQYQSTK